MARVVDTVAEIEIRRPRQEVAAYAANPDNAHAWCKNIEAVEWRSDPPLAVGSRLALVARVLGGRLAYAYEVRELVAGERLVMSTADGPFPMETTYTWGDGGDGATRMTLRNRGEPDDYTVGVRLLAASIRRANRRDLRRLKKILETAR